MSDASNAATLRIVTFPDPPPQPDAAHDCTGYTCTHWLCQAEREQRVQMFTRRPKRNRQPWEATAA